MQIRPKPLLVVTDAATNIVIPLKRKLISVNHINRIFPAIHELQPSGIVLDHDYLGNDMEKVLRRIRCNPFYNNIKIYCYKSNPHTKVDDLLKVLGVQQFIYAGLKKQPNPNTPVKIFNDMLQSTSITKLADAGY